MREVKFRTWDKDEKVMRNWNELILEKDYGDDFYLLGYQENKVVTKYDHQHILMQYTGLKDKNQKEIFEGDIGFDNHSENDGIVKFKEGKFVYEWDNVCEDLCEVNKDIEIIGNVFEHRRLVGGREK